MPRGTEHLQQRSGNPHRQEQTISENSEKPDRNYGALWKEDKVWAENGNKKDDYEKAENIRYIILQCHAWQSEYPVGTVWLHIHSLCQ